MLDLRFYFLSAEVRVVLEGEFDLFALLLGDGEVEWSDGGGGSIPVILSYLLHCWWS